MNVTTSLLFVFVLALFCSHHSAAEAMLKIPDRRGSMANLVAELRDEAATAGRLRFGKRGSAYNGILSDLADQASGTGQFRFGKRGFAPRRPYYKPADY